MIQIEGRNPVYEALRADRATKIFLAENVKNDEKISRIISLSKEKHVPIEIVNKSKLNSISMTGHHQGLIAAIKTKRKKNLKELISDSSRETCFLILNQINDPYNLGAILRIAEATKVDGVIIPKKRSVDVTPTVHRISMGGSIYVSVYKRRLFPILKLLKKEGIQTICVDPAGSANLFNEDLTGSIALVFGGEDQGLNPNIKERCTKRVFIPMFGKLQSLNVSTSVAIVLYERIRQQSIRSKQK